MTQPYNLDGYRTSARRRLPRAVFDFVDGGSEDETTMRDNREAFRAVRLQHRVHETHRPVDTSTSLCGQAMSMPVILAPVGNVGLVHPAGDRGVARVAAAQNLLMLVSANASYTIEEVAEDVDPKPWYQLYTYGDRRFYGSLIDRAQAAGYRGLAVTVDTPTVSNRERDVANAFTRPPRLTRRNAVQILRHPRWTTNVVRHRRVVVKVFGDAAPPPLFGFVGDAKRSGDALGRGLEPITWEHVEWVRSRWNGPMGVKGVVHPADARRAVDLGADVIFVSNHGGRQLDGDIAAIDALAAVVEAVAGRAEVVLDGGVRRGTDVIKALCLGARAVSIGRPWAYALAEGPAGVQTMLSLLRREIEVSMSLLGQADVSRLDASYLAPPRRA